MRSASGATFFVPPDLEPDAEADEAQQVKEQRRAEHGLGRKDWSPDPALSEADQAAQIRAHQAGEDPDATAAALAQRDAQREQEFQQLYNPSGYGVIEAEGNSTAAVAVSDFPSDYSVI